MEYARWALSRVVPTEKFDGTVLPIEQLMAGQALNLLMGKVEGPHFFPVPYNLFYQYYTQYALGNGGSVPDFETWADYLKQQTLPSDTSEDELLVIYRDLQGLRPTDDKYIHALEGLLTEKDRLLLVEVYSDGMEILSDGKKIAGVHLEGPKDSKEYVLRQLSQSARARNVEQATSARDGTSIRDDYAEAKACGGKIGIQTGFSYLDARGGGRKGEMWIVGGHSGDGKSVMLANMGNNVVVTGKNVVFGTAEMHPRQVKRRLYAIHSTRSQFKLPRGINMTDLVMGRLTASVEKVFFDEVVDDFENNPAYGRYEIFQIPYGADPAWIETRLMRYQMDFPIDMFCLDYLQLIHPSRRRGNDREELSEVAKAVKQICLNFNAGGGLFTASAWQTNREEWKKALETGEYTMSMFAGSAEAENSCDMAFYLLRTPETDDQNEVIMGQVKDRDGERQTPVRMFVDWSCAFLGEQV